MRDCYLGVGVLFGVFLVASWAQSSTAQDLVPDIGAVRGMEWYRGPEVGKDLLAKNGFAVTTDFQYDIYLPYLNLEIPHFVTADSVHRTFHVLFEEHLKQLEEVSAGDVLAMVAALRAAVEAQAPDAVASGALAPLAAEAQALSVQFFQVAEALLSGDTIAPEAPDGVGEEVASILAADGIGDSPLFGYRMDYSQFKPRGFYTESPELQRYFRATSWFGNAAFLLHDGRHTLAALMIAKALRDTPKAQQQWQRFDRMYTQFLAPCDDLTPEEYGAKLPELGALDSPAALETAAARLRAELRDPAINSMILPPEEMNEWVARTKGMRFMGKRYLPDSEVFLALITPKVTGRDFPSGLDMMAANGSARAEELMAGTTEGQRPDYIAGARQSKERLEAVKAAEASQYARFLRVAETLTAPPVAQAAPFARTAAYADKSLMTALAAWASTRHAWALHAKQSVSAGAGGPDAEEVPPGYVEPNPAFFSAMDALVKETIALFEAAGVSDLGRFAQFESLVGSLAEIVRKELAGEPFSDDEQYLLCMYGKRLKDLHSSGSGISVGSPWMSQVMDIHTEPTSGQCLEVATGGAMAIYVVMEHKGRPYLLVGGVYSYYEFLQPIENRLTDEEWRRQWDTGHIPELPPWTASFVAGKHDIGTVIQRLRDGEEVAGLEFIQDPALDAFLVGCVLDAPNELHTRSGYLFSEASRRAPEIVNPMLLEMLANGPIPEGKWDGDPRSILGATAADALTGNIRAEDVPALVEIIAHSDARRAMHVAYALSGVEPSIAGDVLIKGLRRCDSDVVKFQLLESVHFQVPITMVPALLEYAESENELLRMKCLLTAGFLWRRFEHGVREGAQIGPNVTERESRAWRRQTENAITEELARIDWEVYTQRRGTLRGQIEEMEGEQGEFYDEHGVYSEILRAEYRVLKFEHDLVEEVARVAGQMALAGAVPFLQKALERSDRAGIRAAAEALVEIGTNDAVDALRSALSVSVVGDVLRGAIDSVRKNGNDPDFQRRGHALVRLLEDRTEVPGAHFRVCDLVVTILTERGATHSPGRPASNTLEDRDAKAREWVAYIQELQLIDAELARERYWNEEY